MVTYIESTPSMGNATHPTTAGTLIRTGQWGIDSTLSGYIIQDVSINEERITDTTQDQKGATVSQLDYDSHWTCSLTVIGGTGAEDGDHPLTDILPGDTSFTFAGKTWKVQNVTFNGTYNDKKRYTINLERWKHFPA